MHDQPCVNCGQPKSAHSIHDEFCLKVNNWTAAEFVEDSSAAPKAEQDAAGPALEKLDQTGLMVHSAT